MNSNNLIFGGTLPEGLEDFLAGKLPYGNLRGEINNFKLAKYCPE
jgi:hypothetical protein